jgi:hypothetical protein
VKKLRFCEILTKKLNFLEKSGNYRIYWKKTPPKTPVLLGRPGSMYIYSKLSKFIVFYWFLTTFSGRLLGHSQVDFSHIFCPDIVESEAWHTIWSYCTIKYFYQNKWHRKWKRLEFIFPNYILSENLKKRLGFKTETKTTTQKTIKTQKRKQKN